jgi:DNA invertase Pin-like site-specific DNA recombinase
MDSNARVPASQYLRMSTEHQRYSLENQSAAIEKYAEKHGFSVIQTYSDAARTGVVFRRRDGLRRLIQDVVQRAAAYEAILVYDVSRWGRFQDCDEAAYYEFLCKSAGIPVHYCAESFSNDNTLPNLILKSLKRVMAAEFSRELGCKVYAGQKRLAALGYRQGGPAGYGLRRLLVSEDGTPKQILLAGQRKSITTDRVIQVAGRPKEVRCVRDIYQMFVGQQMNYTAIASELNRRRIAYFGDAPWNGRAVQTILTHPRYVGSNVYGRSSQRLYTSTVIRPRSEWTIVPKAFEPLIDAATFAQAQERIGLWTWNRSDTALLDSLKTIIAKGGKISEALILATPGVPCATTYRARFGSLVKAYSLLDYKTTWNEQRLEQKRRVQSIRSNLLNQIVALSRGDVTIDVSPTHHTQLRLRTGRLVSVIVGLLFEYRGKHRWLVKPVPAERRQIALLARLNDKNDAIKDLIVIPPIVGSARSMITSENDARLRCEFRLGDLADFSEAVQTVARSVQAG